MINPSSESALEKLISSPIHQIDHELEWCDLHLEFRHFLLIWRNSRCTVVNSPVVVGMRRSLPIRPLPSPADAIHPSVSLPSVSQGVSHHDLAYRVAQPP